jgi:hypothetical protein
MTDAPREESEYKADAFCSLREVYFFAGFPLRRNA